MDEETGIFLAYGVIITMACWPIYVGAFRSLKPAGLSQKDGKIVYQKDDHADQDIMSSKDAYMFPIVGSGALFGLYMLFKLFGKVNRRN